MIFISASIFTNDFKNSAIARRLLYISKLSTDKKWLLSKFKKDKTVLYENTFAMDLIKGYICIASLIIVFANQSSVIQKQTP